MGRYIRVETDVPGLAKLEELIDEHKRLIGSLEINLREIIKTISINNITVRVAETTDDYEQSP